MRIFGLKIYQILVVIALMLAIASSYFVKKKTVEAKGIILNQKEVVRIRDKQGREVATQQIQVVSNNKELVAIIEKYKDSLMIAKAEIADKATQLIILRREMNGKGDGKVTYKTDTVVRYIDYNDEWLTLKAEVGKKDYQLTYTYKDSIDIAIKDKGSLWWKEKEVKIYSYNPNSTTSELKSFTIKERKNRWGIGLQSGVTFDRNLKPTMYIGFGASYNIIGF